MKKMLYLLLISAPIFSMQSDSQKTNKNYAPLSASVSTQSIPYLTMIPTPPTIGSVVLSIATNAAITVLVDRAIRRTDK